MRTAVKRLAVIGMGRSGTSFLARFLAKSGVYFGERPGAKLGKLEHPMGREINDGILAERFGARDGLPYGRLPEAEILVDERWQEKARAFLEYMDRQAEQEGVSGYWGFKDPRTTVLHSLWLDDFDVIVAVFRRPADVVASYLAMDWIHGMRRRAVGLRYWIRFNRSLLTVHERYAGEKPMYVLDFDADVPKQLATLCERLALPVEKAAFRLYARVAGRGLLGLSAREMTRTYNRLLEIRNLL
jgi:hypothetical protein